MNKKIRDIIFYLFVVLFIIGTIILSLYSSGYKFNFKFPLNFSRVLVKTGMISIDSSPRGAKIFLNGKELPSDNLRPWKKNYLKTPAKIKNVLPGNYELVIEKDGYWPFKKRIQVESGLTTFVEDITLFKTDNPTIKSVSDGSFDEESILLSNNNRFLYLENSLKIILLEKDEEKTIKQKILNNQKGDSVKWLKNNQLLLNGILFSVKGSNKNFSKLVGDGVYNWKFNEAENKLYYQDERSVSRIDTEKKFSEIIIENEYKIKDYLVKDSSLFIIKESDSLALIKEYSLERKLLINELLLPKDGDYFFSEERGEYLSIYDKKNKSLYFAEKNNLKRGYRKIEYLNDWQWLSNNEIVFINDWELSYFNIKKNKLNIMSRLSVPLKNLIINSQKKYLVIASDKKIIIYDLRSSFITTILEAEKIKSPVLDRSKDLLYFWGKLNDQQGVYRISVR